MRTLSKDRLRKALPFPRGTGSLAANIGLSCSIRATGDRFDRRIQGNPLLSAILDQGLHIPTYRSTNSRMAGSEQSPHKPVEFASGSSGRRSVRTGALGPTTC